MKIVREWTNNGYGACIIRIPYEIYVCHHHKVREFVAGFLVSTCEYNDKYDSFDILAYNGAKEKGFFKIVPGMDLTVVEPYFDFVIEMPPDGRMR